MDQDQQTTRNREGLQEQATVRRDWLASGSSGAIGKAMLIILVILVLAVIGLFSLIF